MSSEKRVLVLNRCEWDTATRYGAYWTKELIFPVAAEQQVPYVDLYKYDAVKAKWDQAIRDRNAITVGGVGHGNKYVYTGKDGQVLLDCRKSSDLELMRGRFGSFLSCDFGNALPDFMNAGMLGSHSYKRPFYFVTSAFPNGLARPFFVSHYVFDQRWIRAGKTREAQADSDVAWDKAIAEAGPYTLRYLIWDRDSRVFYGDPEAGPYVTAPPPPPPPPEPWYCKYIKWLPEWLRKLFGCK